MHSRWYNVAVVLLWLAAMTWLAQTKILPPLRWGQRPDYDSVVAARLDEPPVAWQLTLDGEMLGWALCTTAPLAHDLTEIRSRVHFQRLPLNELFPEWFNAMLGPSAQSLANLAMDTESVVIIDSLGQLSQFESSVWLEPLADAVRMRGTQEDFGFEVEVRLGGRELWKGVVDLPPDALVGDALSPQTQLPDLQPGQTWTVPTYSPFPPYQGPMEMLAATVEGTERIAWQNRSVDAWMVVYRSQDDSGMPDSRSVQSRLWVHPNGTVLRQESRLLGTQMSFVRLPDADAQRLYDRVEDEEWGNYRWQPILSPALESLHKQRHGRPAVPASRPSGQNTSPNP